MMVNIKKVFDKRSIFFYILFIAVFIFIRSSVFASYMVPSGSMNPTILEGDFFFANKLAYRLKIPLTSKSIIRWATPDRGDVIVFKSPAEGPKILTKRVIGLPGDVIELRDKMLYLNGTEVETRFVGCEGDLLLFKELLASEGHSIQHMRGRNFTGDMRRLVVPVGHIFVMGDNRDNSVDSRFWGCVPLENVEGKLFVRWFSWDQELHRPRFERIRLL
jgi:signal peptidase I